MTGPSPRGSLAAGELHAALRQMLAGLERERQALAALDIDEITGCAAGKRALCETLAGVTPDALDAEARTMLAAARRLNEVNRQIRNLVAANVAARLETLSGNLGESLGAGAVRRAAVPARLRLVANG